MKFVQVLFTLILLDTQILYLTNGQKQPKIPILHKGIVANFFGSIKIAFNKNDIVQVNEETFFNLPNVQEIDLSRNKIEMLETRAFFRLHQLRTIRLSNNAIKQINKQTFSSLINLKNVYLNSNNLENLDQQWFKYVNLELLDLGNNRIEALKNNSFNSLYKLKHLYLNRNIINHIEADAFRGLMQLEDLNLGYNNLKKINIDFTYLTNLKQLVLNSNNFTAVPQAILEDLKDLHDLVIYENPMQCLCLNTIEDWAYDNNVNIDYSYNCNNNNPICANISPAESKCIEDADDFVISELNRFFRSQTNQAVSCLVYKLLNRDFY